MHVRIAWEIYNHQQKAKSDAKPGSLGPPKLGFELLGKAGAGPGAGEYPGKRPGAAPTWPGLPASAAPAAAPANPFDPLGAARDPYSAAGRYYPGVPAGLGRAEPLRPPAPGERGGAAGLPAGYPRTVPGYASPAPAPTVPFGGLAGLGRTSSSSYPPSYRPSPARPDLQAVRDSELRAGRERNGGEEGGAGAGRERSPVRVGSSDSSGPSTSLVHGRPRDPEPSPAGLDMRVTPAPGTPHSRPGSALQPGPADLSSKPGGDPDIAIIGEKEGTRSGANSVGGRTSVNSDHSISRINGTGPPARDSPTVNGIAKSESPAVSRPGGHAAYSGLYGAAGRGGAAYLGATPGLSHAPDPRTLAMFPHLAPTQLRPHNPFDYPAAAAAAASLDPYRAAAAAAADPYGAALLGRDPLREARERELMRLNPLAGPAALQPALNAELERAKALSSMVQGVGLSPAGYPGLPGAVPGYPPSPYPPQHKMVPHHPLTPLYGGQAGLAGLYPGLQSPYGHSVPGQRR